MKYKTEQHKLWHKIVEGQIVSTKNDHPEYFIGMSPRQFNYFKVSLAKRIVGEVLSVDRRIEREKD